MSQVGFDEVCVFSSWQSDRLTAFAGMTIAGNLVHETRPPSVLLGGGASLTPAQVELCRGRARVVAINHAWRLAPWADALHACDPAWWLANPAAQDFAGRKTVVRPQESSQAIDQALATLAGRGIEVLQETGVGGYDPTPGCVRTGRNGGYQALHMEAQRGATRVRPGAIYDLHDADGVPGAGARLVEYLPGLIQRLRAQGYALVPLRDLL